jgi:hypothetical protein
MECDRRRYSQRHFAQDNRHLKSDMADASNLVAVLSAAGTTIASVATLGWYMRGFIEHKINHVSDANNIRHLENLSEFRRIWIALTRLGAERADE